jgi:hypothetical protein
VWVGDSKIGGRKKVRRKKTVLPRDHKPKDRQRDNVSRLAAKAIAAAVEENRRRNEGHDKSRLIPSVDTLRRWAKDGIWTPVFPRVKTSSRSSSPPRRS